MQELLAEVDASHHNPSRREGDVVDIEITNPVPSMPAPLFLAKFSDPLERPRFDSPPDSSTDGFGDRTEYDVTSALEAVQEKPGRFWWTLRGSEGVASRGAGARALLHRRGKQMRRQRG